MRVIERSLSELYKVGEDKGAEELVFQGFGCNLPLAVGFLVALLAVEEYGRFRQFFCKGEKPIKNIKMFEGMLTRLSCEDLCNYRAAYLLASRDQQSHQLGGDRKGNSLNRLWDSFISRPPM